MMTKLTEDKRDYYLKQTDILGNKALLDESCQDEIYTSYIEWVCTRADVRLLKVETIEEANKVIDDLNKKISSARKNTLKRIKIKENENDDKINQ